MSGLKGVSCKYLNCILFDKWINLVYFIRILVK